MYFNVHKTVISRDLLYLKQDSEFMSFYAYFLYLHLGERVKIDLNKNKQRALRS